MIVLKYSIRNKKYKTEFYEKNNITYAIKTCIENDINWISNLIKNVPKKDKKYDYVAIDIRNDDSIISIEYTIKFENINNIEKFKNMPKINIADISSEYYTNSMFGEIRKLYKDDKTYILKLALSEKFIPNIENEINKLFMIDSKYVIKPLQCVVKNSAVIGYVMDFHGTNIEYYLEDKRLKDVNKVIHQIKQGLNDIHSKNICHNDLDIDNILIDDNEDIKIIDFGQALFINEKIPEHIQFRIPVDVCKIEFDNKLLDKTIGRIIK